jgi:DNA-directed RNA polymerase I subunit RPA1
MGHRVRVLHNPTQKTIRMHYANCNTYNADFDGDEMNCHFPQNDIGRAEAQYIASTDLQYIVPTDGSPLRGLIQDHVVGGVKMCKRDTFFERGEYQQLLFAALASLPGLEVIRLDADIELMPPAIIKPRELWTGKQVISTLLLHLRRGTTADGDSFVNMPGISMERSAKTPGSAFGEEHQEHNVIIRDGELLRGVLDKSAYGATDFSLVHAVYEAYGPSKAGLLLNALGRLFTAYIQSYSGHSCRMEDLVLTPEADEVRRSLVQSAYNLGARAAKAWADSEGGKVPISALSPDKDDVPLKPVEKASTSAKIGELLSGSEGPTNFASLDSFMQGQLNPLASTIVKECLPKGLAVPFPYNTFSVMTTTGAKGSIVNQSQVTCALGQQALEGRRVPRMSSGRTLPSFAPFDPNPRADGFVMDRFLTGIRPQEYYFHCMAGREGLVDTAVKTSRSGYLQRCLMKHLEELKIGYDYTVRNAENNVVQFLYGEDGLDPTKCSYLDCTSKSFEFIARNLESLRRRNTALPSSTASIAKADAERLEELRHTSQLTFSVGDSVMARRLRDGREWKRGALCTGWFSAVVVGVHSDDQSVDVKYDDDGTVETRVPVIANLGKCGGALTPAASTYTTLVKAVTLDPIISAAHRGHRLGQSGSCISERVASAAGEALNNEDLQRVMSGVGVTADQMDSFIAAKYGTSLCAPGEAVGCIAAQSIGEPSTQMTLNTFHLAGAGANVTLGIPRLREIIMTASQKLKTPTMSVPINDDVSEKSAIRLTRAFSKLTLMELLASQKGIVVTERLERRDAGDWSRTYYVTLKLHPAERIKDAFGLTLHDIARVVAKNCVPLLAKLMRVELKRSSVEGDVNISSVEGGESRVYRASRKAQAGEDDDGDDGPKNTREVDELGDDDDDDIDEDEDNFGEEDGVSGMKQNRRKISISYENDDDSVEQMMGKDKTGKGGDNDDNDDDDDDEDSKDDNAKKGNKSGLGGEDDGSSDDDGDSDDDDVDQKDSKGKDVHVLAGFKDDSLSVNTKQNTISLQPLRVDPSVRPLLMVGLVENAASKTLVSFKKNIEQSFVNEEEDGRGRCLQTLGVNFEQIWNLSEVDHDRLLSNDIWAVRCTYGVEAARNSIMYQIRSVFAAYGIEVDPRHLSLIADFMTFNGGFKAMNRGGMEHSSSPLLQMSFETTVTFLRQAAIRQMKETVTSPSANIVFGRPVQHGTGAFTLIAQ